MIARASVVIVSRGRPGPLALCLQALALQDHPSFEIILVADPAGMALPCDLPLKRVGFDRANISEARNLGIAQAAGDVIAFIDDDAVAEPGWLSGLSAPFANPQVIAATGWTRGTCGFRWQTQAARIDASGVARRITPEPQTRLLAPENGAPVSTLGTNCAFRATHLRAIGGFDPVFAYHLDESDVNLRMSVAFPKGLTAIVPMAQVIHMRAGSALRNAASVPVDLSLTGRSAAIFARRHDAPVPPDAALLGQNRKRLIRHMLDGRLDPQGVAPLMQTLKAGLAEGHAMALPPPPRPRDDRPPPFRPVPQGAPRGHLLLSGWHWQAIRLRERAALATAGGQIVTVILLSPTLLPHRLGLTEGGWFEQIGGLWGPSEPGDPAFTPWRLRDRLARESLLTINRRNPPALPASAAPGLSQGTELA
ncbi:MAG: glycosyltransferase [Paracoccus sp. (in: a-proteobacteria)]|nr:glycosyltransferase [Paracoccus sp. (in: a-proteobacteria)]